MGEPGQEKEKKVIERATDTVGRQFKEGETPRQASKKACLTML